MTQLVLAVRMQHELLRSLEKLANFTELAQGYVVKHIPSVSYLAQCSMGYSMGTLIT